MLAPMNEFYTDEEYVFALKQMRKNMERLRIIREATLLNQMKVRKKSTFKSSITVTASNTKSSLQTVSGQLDSAIKGEVRNKLEEVIAKKLPKYDKVIS